MTKQQIEQAQQMNKAGVSWAVIASYFGVSQNKLLKYRKHYEKQTQGDDLSPTTTTSTTNNI